jgi:hypothetical protein
LTSRQRAGPRALARDDVCLRRKEAETGAAAVIVGVFVSVVLLIAAVVLVYTRGNRCVPTHIEQGTGFDPARGLESSHALPPAAAGGAKPKARRSATARDEVVVAGKAGVVIVGAGLVTGALLNALPDGVRALSSVREASQQCGGRALSVPRQTTAVSTLSTPREFAAWIYHPFVHMQTTAYLARVKCNTTTLQLRTSQSFIWSPATGKQPFRSGSLPTCAEGEALGACAGAAAVAGDRSGVALLWFAHTGFWPADAPSADASLIRNMDLPGYGRVVTGFGWQDAAMRGVGNVPVIYDRRLTAVSLLASAVGRNTADNITVPGRTTDKIRAARLEYATGDVEDVNLATTAVVLTLPPQAMARVRGVPKPILELIARSFVTVPVGILYATWTTATAWWATAGLAQGVAATSLPIGRVFVVSANDLRCQMTGARDVEFWTNKVVAQGGTPAAQEEVAAQLSRVFGISVPLPAAVSFQPWPEGVALWTTAVARGPTSTTLSRPFGADVGIWWGSADLSHTPGWVEGAIDVGIDTAKAVQSPAGVVLTSAPAMPSQDPFLGE